MRARLDEGLVVLEVGDHGQWKHDPPDFEERGRSLMMISRLVDALEIDAERPRHHDPNDGARCSRRRLTASDAFKC